MARRCLAIGLALMLVSTNAFAQNLRGSIRRAAEQEAALQQQQQQAQSSSKPIPPAFLWSSVGLLAAGGVFLGLGFAEDEDTETCVSTPEELTCVSHRKVFLTTGGLMLGTGGALLGVGMVKAHSPQVTFRRGGVTVRQTLSVPGDLGLGRLFRR